MKISSTNPAKNYETVGEVEFSTEQEIRDKVEAAHAAKKAWRKLGVKKRAKALQPIIDECTDRTEEIAQAITQETGKPITEARSEVERYIVHAQWFLDNAEKALADQPTLDDDTALHRIVYEPYGVVAAIAPWNYPFGMAVWGIVPNLVVGNVVVFKTSEECPLVGKLIEEIFKNHDLPEGVFSEVYGDGEVGDVLTNQDVNYIWFTGSTGTGKNLYKKAADKFIRCTLEMGGSSPGIVFEDIDPQEAADIMFPMRFKHCGQVCTSIKRLIVHEDLYDDVLAALSTKLIKQKIGDPADEHTTIGSLVAKRQVDLLAGQLQDAIDKGAKIYTQKEIPKTLNGAFFPPTILTDVTPDMRVWKEEVFGPILPVVSFKTEEEAITMANDTKYGLNARVMTNDPERAERVSSQIEAGGIKINSESSFSADSPFGGYKLSGIGREHGIHGLRELCQIKVIAKEK